MALHARRYCASWARAQHPGLVPLFSSALWVMTVQQHGQTRPCGGTYRLTLSPIWPYVGRYFRRNATGPGFTMLHAPEVPKVYMKLCEQAQGVRVEL